MLIIQEVTKRFPPAVSKEVTMVQDSVSISGKRINFSASESRVRVKTPYSGVTAVNLHGFFASGTMYWRESARLCQNLGMKLINPNLPGFGGSTPIAWSNLSMAAVAETVYELLDYLEVEKFVILGHSMGGSVAIEMANLSPERVLGIIYRDGAASSSWKIRKGLLVDLLAPAGRDISALIDLAFGAFLDVPDLFAGKFTSTFKLAMPDLRKNIQGLTSTLPMAALLFNTDLTDSLLNIKTLGIPFLLVWGALDQITPAYTAHEVAELTASPILWVPGGHSWMLARPSTQYLLLKYDSRGKEFLSNVLTRQSSITSLRAPSYRRLKALN